MRQLFNKYHGKAPDDAVFIGRPSKWGNPFIHGKHGTREEVVAKFEAYLLAHPTLLEEAKKELRDRDLVCFCYPLACHGEVLLRYANKRRKNPAAARNNVIAKRVLERMKNE